MFILSRCVGTTKFLPIVVANGVTDGGTRVRAAPFWKPVGLDILNTEIGKPTIIK